MKLCSLLIVGIAFASNAAAMPGSLPAAFDGVTLTDEKRTPSTFTRITQDDQEAECRARFVTFEQCINIDCGTKKTACKEKCSKAMCSKGSTVNAPMCNLTRDICRKVPASGPPGPPPTKPIAPPQTGKECWDREAACQKKPECSNDDTANECFTKCHCEQCQYNTCVKKGNYQDCFWYDSGLAGEDNVVDVRGRSYACKRSWGMWPGQ